MPGQRFLAAVEGSRSARGAATQERILEAATDVFSTKGYYATAVDDIVRASGTSKGSFYHFFSSKEAVFLKLIEVLTDRLVAKVEAAISRERGARARIDAALHAVLDVFSRHPQLTRIFLVEAAGLGHGTNRKLLEVKGRVAGLIARHLDNAVAEGEIAPLDTNLAANVWLGAISEVVVRWLYTGQPASLEDVLPQLRAMLLRSVGLPLESESTGELEAAEEQQGPDEGSRQR